MERQYDRRADVGQKIYIGIITAILSTVFLGALGMSIKNSDALHNIDVRVVKLEQFTDNQNRLNMKLDTFVDRSQKILTIVEAHMIDVRNGGK